MIYNTFDCHNSDAIIPFCGPCYEPALDHKLADACLFCCYHIIFPNFECKYNASYCPANFLDMILFSFLLGDDERPVCKLCGSENS